MEIPWSSKNIFTEINQNFLKLINGETPLTFYDIVLNQYKIINSLQLRQSEMAVFDYREIWKGSCSKLRFLYKKNHKLYPKTTCTICYHKFANN